MAMATAMRRLVPLLDRVLVEKIVPPTKTAGGILLPESSSTVYSIHGKANFAGLEICSHMWPEAVLHSGKVIAVGAGARARDGTIIPPDVKEGDIVLLPEYGGSHVKLEDKEFVLFRNDDILGILEQ